MKKINFVTTLSPEKQYAIARWWKVTLFVGVCSIAGMLYVVSEPVLTYVALKKERAALKTKALSYDEKYRRKDVLQKDYDAARAHASKIERYVGSPRNPYDHLKAIMAACGEGVKLESVRCTKKQCELTVLCPTAEHATVFTQRLAATTFFAGIKLVSLQRDGGSAQFRAVVKGVMVHV